MYVLGTTCVDAMENLGTRNGRDDEYSGGTRRECRADSPTVRLWVIAVVELNEESTLADVGWNAFELESLETSPSKE